MTKEQFINLLESILEKKKENKQLELVEPYDELYDKCVLGYDISRTKEAYDENKLFAKTESAGGAGFEGSQYLKGVLTSLINCYGKDAVAQILRDL